MVLREVRRFLKSSRLLSVSGVLILALGIGTSGLTLALLLAFSSLTYPGMQTIAYATIAEETEGGGSAQIAWDRFEELRGSSKSGSELAAYSKSIQTTLGREGDLKSLSVAAVSSGFFSRFTSHLTAGRDFNLAEEDTAGSHAIILSTELAARLFHTSQNAVEQVVQINDSPYEVVGIAPQGFRGIFGDVVDAWVPANCVIPLILDASANRGASPNIWKVIHSFYAVAASDRMSSNMLAKELDSDLSTSLHAAGKAALHTAQGLTIDPARDERLRKWLRLGLLLALAFTLVSSLNVCLLLMARTPLCIEEVLLKKALGASVDRIVLELMTGPAAVMFAGLFAACLIWMGGLVAISRISEFYRQMLYGSRQTLSLAFAAQLLLAFALIMAIALIPALAALRGGSAPRMGYSTTFSRRTGLFVQIPVVLQIACCIGTSILAGMVAASLIAMMSQPLGYDPDHLVAVCIGPAHGPVTFSTGSGGTSPEALALNRLIEQVRVLRGVRGVSYVSSAPLDNAPPTQLIQRSDRPSAAPRTVNDIGITPGYFHTIGSRILRGTDISSRNTTGSAYEIVVNDLLARELWPDANPIDQTVKITNPAWGGMPSYSYVATVVGIVEDMRMSGFTGSPEPTFFLSIEGHPFMDVRPDLIVDGSESLRSLEDLTAREVPALIPGMGVLETYSVADRTRESLTPEKDRVYYALTGALIMALTSSIGLYGALAYYIRTRRRELAVRICLGASPSTIRNIILARAAWCAISAIALSLPLWPVLAQLSSNEYLGRISWSTSRALVISLACASVSIFISLVPAAAATSISPSEVLKEQ